MESSFKRSLLTLAVASLLTLGLAACGDGSPQQESSNPASTESSDTAATPYGTSDKPAE